MPSDSTTEVTYSLKKLSPWQIYLPSIIIVLVFHFLFGFKANSILWWLLLIQLVLMVLLCGVIYFIPRPVKEEPKGDIQWPDRSGGYEL